MKSRLIITIAAAMGCCAARDASDWPRFRGPNGTGVSSASRLPIEFNAQTKLRWKVVVPKGHSSPVLTDDRIFLTGFEGTKLLTLCLDRHTGAIRWRQEASRTRNSKPLGANTPASPSPATDGKNVYAFFEDFGVISYSSDGKERWRQPLGPFNNPYGMAGSPIVSDRAVILQCDQDTGSFLIALDRKNGRVLWKTERPEATHGFSTPILYKPGKGPEQVIVSGSYLLSGYSVETGEKVWWVRGMAWQAKSVPVVNADTLYVHSWMASLDELGTRKPDPFAEVISQHDTNKDGKISKEESPDAEMKKLWFLFDLDKDGNLDQREWSIHQARGSAGSGLFAIRLGGRGDITDSVLWRYNKSLPNIPSPLLYRNILFVLREGGILTSLNPSNGEVIKQDRLSGAPGAYYASPVAADGKIYAASQEGKVAVIKAEPQWQVLTVNDLKEECWATPAIADGRLYVRTQNALYCFGEGAPGA